MQNETYEPGVLSAPITARTGLALVDRSVRPRDWLDWKVSPGKLGLGLAAGVGSRPMEETRDWESGEGIGGVDAA